MEQTRCWVRYGIRSERSSRLVSLSDVRCRTSNGRENGDISAFCVCGGRTSDTHIYHIGYPYHTTVYGTSTTKYSCWKV